MADTKKLMIFCTCTEYKKEHYLERVANWYHNLKAINSLQLLKPDYYVFNDGTITIEDIRAIDPTLLNDDRLFFVNNDPMLGRLSDLSFPGWVRSFKRAMTFGSTRYDYIVHIENDVLLLHPDKIVSYFTQPGMFCSHWKGRDIIDSTVMIMNDKRAIASILAFLNSKDDANCMLIEGVFTSLCKWQFVFNGDRLNGELSHLSMDLDFIAQLWRSEVHNPYSSVIADSRINHIFVAGGSDLVLPDNQKHYVGIQCSAITIEECRNDKYIHDNDDEHDNIADRYTLYGPLTALYWIWKHHHTQSENTGVGFFCDDMWVTNGFVFLPNCMSDYRTPRYNDLVPIQYDTTRNIACNPEYTFDHYDIVVPRKQAQFRSGNAKNVIAFMVTEFSYDVYSTVESILRDCCYDYAYGMWKDYAMDEIAPQVMRPIFITSWKYFKQYCELLFTVCFELEKRIGEKKLIESYYASKNGDTQVFKRLAVYLLNLFIFRNRLVVKETSALHFIKQGVSYEQPFST